MRAVCTGDLSSSRGGPPLNDPDCRRRIISHLSVTFLANCEKAATHAARRAGAQPSSGSRLKSVRMRSYARMHTMAM